MVRTWHKGQSHFHWVPQFEEHFGYRNILAIKNVSSYLGEFMIHYLILGVVASLKFELAIWDKSHSLLHDPLVQQKH
jgi:hypothetical protein